jgi:chromosome condensin MukBEF MukE localization factor
MQYYLLEYSISAGIIEAIAEPSLFPAYVSNQRDHRGILTSLVDEHPFV